MFKQALGLCQPILARKVVDRPESANSKRPFSAIEPIISVLVPIDQAILSEPPRDQFVGRRVPSRVGRSVADARHL